MALAGWKLARSTILSRSIAPAASFYGRYFKCWQKGGHGTVDLHKAIAQSATCFSIRRQQDGDRHDREVRRNDRLGRRPEWTYRTKPQALVPSSKWKMRIFRQKWYAGETISVAIGQGALQ